MSARDWQAILISAALLAALALHLHAGTAGQLLHRLGEAQVVELHQKTQGVTVRPAAEAVIELLVMADREGGRVLLMERAETAVVAPALLELHALGNDVDDIGPRQQVIDEAL